MTLRDEIGVNETIVWQGKKDKRVSVFEAIFNPLLIFALVWFIFDMQFISSFLSYGGSFGTGAKSILVFFIIHLAPVWIYIAGVLTAGLKPATSEPLLAVVFGGVLLGAGIGLVLRGGGCLDGTETVALLISRKTNFSVGQIVFSINIIIYAAAGLLFGWDRALYSLLTYFITFKVIDMVENGMEEAKSVMIITQDGTAMADTIFQQLGRTCTILEGTGLISGNKAVLYCVITRLELPAMRRIIHNADQSAFVTVSDVSEIIGNHIKQLPPQADADNKPT